MKCQLNSKTTHDVLISKEISYKSYKEICGGEKKKVNLGFNNLNGILSVEKNSLMSNPPIDYNTRNLYGETSSLSYDWEVLSKFFSLHNIEPIWLDCNMNWGRYDEDLGGWTGCVGKV